MPNVVKLISGKYRVVEKASGIITKNRAGTAVDGGGHPTRAAAQSQVGAIASNKT